MQAKLLRMTSSMRPLGSCCRLQQRNRSGRGREFYGRSSKRNIDSFEALFIEERIVSSSLRDTLLEDKIDDRPNRVTEDYRKQFPDDSTSNETLNAADRDISQAQAFQSGNS